ncbi:hypothetical protein HYH03_017462 [Edaphochlamys debaryana]|uniref:Protein kinase domain-containing protein n=1 Tax=Edaphochlamys debaryana TaxID=47281 RepID=A0A835XHT7_9CHLO|nr:hypothetical protein HYH03_017462 [Edaphochlamys debaryana]|eukprot:KAG2483659.1 hypothetical protein HYH03_017462 [Edaphochlamys debaryana]
MRAWALGLALVALLAAPRLIAASSSLRTVEIRTGRDLHLALADPDVGDLVLVSPVVTISPSDAEGLQLPIDVARNVTIRGPSPTELWPTLDLAFQRWKIRLRSGASLTVEHAVVTRFRLDNAGANRVPGVDIFAPPLEGERGLIIFSQAATVFPVCYPVAIAQANVKAIERPAGFPGEQTRQFSLPQDGCTNSSSAPPMQRCWPLKNAEVDVVFQGADIDPPTQKALPSNNIYVSTRTFVLCAIVLDMACVVRLGPVGCWVYTVGLASPPLSAPTPAVAELQTAGGGGDGGSGGGNSTLIAALCGSLLGVAALALIVAGVLWARAARRRRLQRQSEPQDVTTKGVDFCEGGAGAGPDAQSSKSASRPPPGPAFQRPSDASGHRPGSGPVSLPTCASQHDGSGPGSAAPSGSIAADPVTPFTPKRPDLRLGIRMFRQQQGYNTVPRCSDASLTESTVSTSLSTSGLRAGAGAGLASHNTVELLPVTRGRGGFGQVFEGTFQGQRVAVKVVSEAWAGGAEQPCATQLKCFGQEVQVLGRCDHPCIVRLLAASLQPPLCLVMELCETSLDRVLHSRRGTVLPMCKVLHIAIEIAKGLEYLHPTIVHRDLKPANVLLNNADSDTPVVKLTDFGLSRLNHTVIITRAPGAGTPAYLAPECYEASNVEAGVITHHADMYSYGILLWEMLAGRRPWEGRDHLEVARDVMGKRARPPLDVMGPVRCPPKLRELMTACWEHDPLRRPAAAEVVKQLEMLRDEHDLDNANALPSVHSAPLGAVPIKPSAAARFLGGPGLDDAGPAQAQAGPARGFPDPLSVSKLPGPSGRRWLPTLLSVASLLRGQASGSGPDAGPDGPAAGPSYEQHTSMWSSYGRPHRPRGSAPGAGGSLERWVGATTDWNVRELADAAAERAGAEQHGDSGRAPAPGKSVEQVVIRFAVQLLGGGGGGGTGGGAGGAGSGLGAGAAAGGEGGTAGGASAGAGGAGVSSAEAAAGLGGPMDTTAGELAQR